MPERPDDPVHHAVFPGRKHPQAPTVDVLLDLDATRMRDRETVVRVEVRHGGKKGYIHLRLNGCAGVQDGVSQLLTVSVATQVYRGRAFAEAGTTLDLERGFDLDEGSA